MAVSDALPATAIASFGPFHLIAAERLLVNAGEPVAMGSRSLDILIALIERPGEVVDRRDLIKRVWPDVTVEEANLRVHVSSLRKALGDGKEGARYIASVPGRGYCFVAPVQRSAAVQSAVPTAALASRAQKLPPLLARMVGREETVAALCSLVASRRFVSIVGPGGMGKTTVAVAVAHALLDDFRDAVCFVDLGSITDAAHVLGAVSSALGCFVQAQDPIPSLLAYLSDRRILLILDNCEHLIDAVAILTENLFSAAPLVHLLTTSREALRVEGETVHLLLPLDGPLDDGELTAIQALASPAVQLFMERAAASGYQTELRDADAPTVAGICRRLDGIALAIELAASRVGAYGIRGTADLLENRFKLLWQGRRSALPRHQTLQALLDWSFNLLPEYEKATLCKLSIFVGTFTLDGALSVASDTGADAPKMAAAAASLVDKSLLWTSDLSGSVYHRLPETTRAYAAAKLVEAGETGAVARRHALHYINLFKSDTIRATAFTQDMSAAAPHLGNVRAALEWSFSSAGDAAIGIELAARSAPLFLGFSLLSECERWCKRGLAALQEADRGTLRQLALQEGLSISSMFTRGNSEEVRTAIEQGLGLAETLGDRQHQLHLLAGLNIFLTRTGDFRSALAVAERSLPIAREIGDAAGIIMSEWMLGVSHHLVGDQAAAQRHCDIGLELAAASGHVQVNFFGYDHRVRALVALARVLWVRGMPERALEVAHQAIGEAATRNHPVTVCISYIYTIPVFLWTGDLDGAQERIERLIAHAAKYSLRPYHAVGLALKGELLIARGQPLLGIELLQGALLTLQAERHNILRPVFCRALAEGFARCGQSDASATAIAEALEFDERAGQTVDFPDLLRAQAEIIIAGPQPDLAAAEETLVRSLEWAHKQSALGWELRAAIPLARLWAQHGRASDAQHMLAGIYQRFTEGFATPDLTVARRLLDELKHMSDDTAPAVDPGI